MIIRQLNRYYFCFTLSAEELEDEQLRDQFLSEVKAQIPGERGRDGKAKRFYLPDQKLWCIHRTQWHFFLEICREVYDFIPSWPFTQEEFF